jgi:hypothetical protein
MARGCGVALLLALSLAGAAGEWRPRTLRQQQRARVTTASAWTTTPAARFEQRVDHFDALSDATWQQRYFVNATFWEGGGRVGPVFLCVGGEGASTFLRSRCAWRVACVAASCSCATALTRAHSCGAQGRRCSRAWWSAATRTALTRCA